MDVFRVRKETGFDRYDAAVMAIYAAVLAFAIRHHIAWADEAQAWLIARDSTLHELLFRRLHYEGAPALWPLILWVAARLHMPYTAIGWLSGALALPGIYLLLRYSPFPRILRWLIPFTFFFQYQYAVIARPYVLYPGLFFALCIVYTLPRPRPVLFALIAGLIANVSAHGAIFACLLTAVYLWDIYRNGQGTTSMVSKHRAAGAAGIFVLLLLVAAAVAFPAPDVAFAVKSTTSKGMVHALLLKLMPEEQRPRSAIPLDEPLKDPYVTKAQEAIQGEDTFAKVVGFVVGRAVLSIDAATYPIAKSNLLAVAFLASWACWLWSRRHLWMTPILFVGIFLCAQIWLFNHHTGLFLIFIVTTVWIALNRPIGTRGGPWIDPAFAALSTIVILLQIGWTLHSVRSELRGAYDAGLATEQFLAENYPGRRIAGFTFETVSTQPYVDQNLYINWNHTYFVWGRRVIITQRRTETLAMHPDVVVIGNYITESEDLLDQWVPLAPPGRQPYQEMLEFWQQHGYRTTNVFCGDRYIRMGAGSRLCEVILVSGAG